VGSEREWWGGSVTVISIQVCVFCQPSESRRGQRGNVGVISIRLCVFLSAEWKQKRTREGMLGWECNCY